MDETVLRRLAEHSGVEADPIYVAHGKDRLRDSVPGYNSAARFGPWLIIVDLDHDADCAPPFVSAWLPQPSPHMCFRVAVRAIEAWLMADRDRLASFLHVSPHNVPGDPETLPDPKRAIVDLARQSRRPVIQAEMVPRPRSGRAIGPAYTSRMIEFATDRRRGWRPTVAARSADSLARCLRALRVLVRSETPSSPPGRTASPPRSRA